MITEEEIARALCRLSFDGYDPDEVVVHKPPPDCCELPSDASAPEHCYYDEDSEEWVYAWKRWRLYAAQARAVLALVQPAIDAAVADGFEQGVDRVCATRKWSEEMSHAWHRAIPDVPKAFGDLAAAIRSKT